MSKKEKKLKLIPLGGMGEIGKNMTLLEYGEDIVVIDCGLAFPDDDMPGIDVVIPDMTYLEENREKLRGFVITHGHEDHIGAIPYALQKFDVPVYGTDLTVALMEHKLQEMHVSGRLNVVKPGDTVELGCFKVEFIKTSHSIPGAVALAITTPLGVILHTGDFKIDLTPLDGQPIDINRLAYYGSKGVLCLLSDSTNVERSGYTQSEREIGKTFEHYFDIAKGRIIVASFASNVYRLQQVADVAIEHDRVICFAGKSMEQIVAYAQNLGYMHIPQDRIVKVDDLGKFHDDKVCIITTGSQGEPMSGLYRMADVHVSGHACREELKLMLHIAKPKFFIPAHGEFRHLMTHGRLALDMGIPEENIFVMNNGDVVTFTKKGAAKAGEVPSGAVMVDGSKSIEDAVIRDRRELSSQGLVVAVVTLDKETGREIAPVELISRGFVYMKESDDLMAEAAQAVAPEVKRFETEDKANYGDIKAAVKSKLKSFFKSRTKRTPLIIPIVIEGETYDRDLG